MTVKLARNTNLTPIKTPFTMLRKKKYEYKVNDWSIEAVNIYLKKMRRKSSNYSSYRDPNNFIKKVL